VIVVDRFDYSGLTHLSRCFRTTELREDPFVVRKKWRSRALSPTLTDEHQTSTSLAARSGQTVIDFGQTSRKLETQRKSIFRNEIDLAQI
jgi:hypothetical protein